MKRLNTITSYGNLNVVDYKLPVTKHTEFIVDDSCFIPMSEAVKQLGSNSVGANEIKNYYDFPDGNDNGMEIPITRTKNGKDIAEISSNIMDNINEMSEKIETARKHNAKKAAFEKSLSDIKNSGSNSSTPSSE